MITIVTPTYNREILVQATIKSIQAQTYTNWELIIIDDGSTDNTEHVITGFLNDKRIRYIKKSNSGQPDSLNLGVSMAKGNFITFLDSDDEAYPNWLEVVNKQIRQDTGLVCVGAYRKLLDGTLIKEDLHEELMFGKKFRVKFTCGSLFIRRTVFSAVGGYDTDLKCNIQTDLGIRLMMHLHKVGLKVVSIEQNLVQINVHAGERIRTNWEKMRIGGVQFVNKHYHFIHQHNPKEIANIYATIAFSHYKTNHRKKSIHYLVKAIQHNPLRLKNYLRIFKYSLT